MSQNSPSTAIALLNSDSDDISDQTTIPFDFDPFLDISDFDFPIEELGRNTSTPIRAAKRPREDLDDTDSELETLIESSSLQRLLAQIETITSTNSLFQLDQHTLQVSIDQTRAVITSIRSRLRITDNNHQTEILNNLLRRFIIVYKSNIESIQDLYNRNLLTIIANKNKELEDTSQVLHNQHLQTLLAADEQIDYVNRSHELLAAKKQVEFKKLYNQAFQEIINFRKEYVTLNKLIESLSTDNIQLKKDLAKIKTDTALEKETLKTEIVAISAIRDTFAKNFSKATERVNKYDSELRSIEDYITDFISDEATLKHLENLNISISDLLQKFLYTYKSTLSDLHNQNRKLGAEQNQKAKDFHSQLLQANHDNSKLNTEINQLKIQNDTISSQLANKDKFIFIKDSTISQLTTKLAENNNQLIAKDSDINRLNSQLRVQDSQIVELQSDVNKLKSAFETKSKAYQQEYEKSCKCDAALNTLTEQLQILKNNLSDQDNQILEYSHANQNLLEQLEILKDPSTNFQEKYTAECNKVAALRTELSKKLDQINYFEKSIANLEEQVQQFDTNFNADPVQHPDDMQNLIELNQKAFVDINAHSLLQTIPTYSGESTDTIDIKRWFKIAERVTSIWSDADRLRHLPSKLSGIALKYYEKLTPTSYNYIKDELIKRFYVRQPTAFYKHLFENITMKQHERVVDYKERLADAYHNAYEFDNDTNYDEDSWTKRREQSIKDRFIIGLRPDIKSAIIHLITDESSLYDVVTNAENVESSFKYLANLTFQDPVGQLTHKINSIETKMQNLTFDRNRSHSPRHHRSRSNSANRPFIRSRSNSTNRSTFDQARSNNNNRFPNNYNNRSPSIKYFSTQRTNNSSPFRNRYQSSGSNYPQNRSLSPFSQAEKTDREKTDRRPKGNCYNCGKPGHYRRQCRSAKRVSFDRRTQNN